MFGTKFTLWCVYEGIKGNGTPYFFLDVFAKRTSYQKFRLRDYLFSKLLKNPSPNDCSARIDIGQMYSLNLTTGSTVDEIWMPRQQLMILSHIIKDTTLHLKISWNRSHVDSGLSTQSSYRKDWRLLMKESKDSWLATIHFFDRHLKKRCYKSYGKDIKK